MSTLDYYNQNAEEYCTGTAAADVSVLYAHFEPLLPPKALILDAGCGSGRDTRHFMQAGHTVTAMDGSAEMCRHAARLTGVPVQCMLFREIGYDAAFDAVWACASLLHVPRSEMPEILSRLSRALRPGGIFYASYKYGRGERLASGRFFSDYTEQDLPALTGYGRDLSLVEYWVSEDVRPGRSREKWLNILWRKNSPCSQPDPFP